MKIGSLTNSNMLSSMMVFICPVLKHCPFCPICFIRWKCSFVLRCARNILFGKILTKNSKWFVYDETSYLNWLKYSEFDGDAYLSCLGPKIIFGGKFRPKNQICLFKMRLGALTNSNM